MRRKVNRFSEAMAASCVLLFAAVALRYGMTLQATSENVPLSITYPGSERKIFRMFHLYNGGDFELRVLQPVKPDHAPEDDSGELATSFAIELSSAGGKRHEYVVNSVRLAGKSAYEKVYVGPLVSLPRGDYRVLVVGRDRADTFTPSGASIELVRNADVGRALFAVAMEWFSYLMFATVVVLIVVASRHADEAARPSA